MSALPISPLSPAPAPGRRAPAALRLVPDTRPAASAAPVRPTSHVEVAVRVRTLAPTTVAQAWRRRVGVAVLLVSVLVSLVTLVLPSPTVATVPVAAETVVVQPGDTLWAIAAAHAPDGTSTPAYVAAIVELNGLPGSTVDAWDVLLLPAG